MKDWQFDGKELILPNGLKVVTIKRDTQLFAINLGVKIGPLYEKKEEKGISHFIEHMLFKGTKNRDNETLNKDLENIGGEYNAYTDYGCTVYSVSALEEEIYNGLEILSDMVKNSSFLESELEKERGVILAEIRTSKDDIEDYSFKKTHEVAFSKSPLKYDIIGNEHNVKSFSRDTLFSFYKNYYTPDNSYISIVSPLDHDDAEKLILKYFSHWQGSHKEKNEVLWESNKEGVFISKKKDIEQSTVVYLYTFHGIEKDLELPLKILSHNLGESSNSILFRELREKRGLAYDVYTHLDLSRFIKSMAIYTAVGEESVNEAIEVINEAILDIKNEKIEFNDDTVNLMKKVHKTAVASTLEDSAELCNYVIHQMLEGESIYEFIKDMEELQSIENEDIYKAGRAVLNGPTIHVLKSS